MQVEYLFPTPLCVDFLDRDFTQEELDFVEESSKDTKHNMLNEVSINQNVLDAEPFSNLKLFIENKINWYQENIISTASSSLYITQSWLNYTQIGESHHRHAHPNSIVSGVLYFQSFNENDRINFHTNTYKQISLNVSQYNKFNSEVWWYPVRPKQLILFPSSLYHEVPLIENATGRRISLAFNTFAKGVLGSGNSNDLILF